MTKEFVKRQRSAHSNMEPQFKAYRSPMTTSNFSKILEFYAQQPDLFNFKDHREASSLLSLILPAIKTSLPKNEVDLNALGSNEENKNGENIEKLPTFTSGKESEESEEAGDEYETHEDPLILIDESTLNNSKEISNSLSDDDILVGNERESFNASHLVEENLSSSFESQNETTEEVYNFTDEDVGKKNFFLINFKLRLFVKCVHDRFRKTKSRMNLSKVVCLIKIIS